MRWPHLANAKDAMEMPDNKNENTKDETLLDEAEKVAEDLVETVEETAEQLQEDAPIARERVGTEVPPPSRWAGLPTRIGSAVVLAGVFFVMLAAGGWFFSWFIFMAALIMIREWNQLNKKQGPFWRFAGLLYVSVPCASLLWLRGQPEGMMLVLFIILCVVATDVGAYFTGRQFGKTKLAPALSPGKTWEGLAGGALAAALVGALASGAAPYPASFWGGLVLGPAIAVVAQGGDLFESFLKRRAGVKDSGTLIPGHGGILDRADGLIPTLPLFALLVGLS